MNQATSGSSSRTKPRLHLSSYDRLSQGHLRSRVTSEGSVSFRDIDGDEQIDLIAPFERLVHLKPLHLFVPTPYRLTPSGLKQAPDLINVVTPSSDNSAMVGAFQGK